MSLAPPRPHDHRVAEACRSTRADTARGVRAHQTAHDELLHAFVGEPAPLEPVQGEGRRPERPAGQAENEHRAEEKRRTPPGHGPSVAPAPCGSANMASGLAVRIELKTGSVSIRDARSPPPWGA